MKDTSNKPFIFGFLNNAQDAQEIGEFESADCKSLDVDKQALGQLVPSGYTYPTLPTMPTKLTAVFNGMSFRLAPNLSSASPAVGQLQYWTGTAWRYVNLGDLAHPTDETPQKARSATIATKGGMRASEVAGGQISNFSVTENVAVGAIWPPGTAQSILVQFRLKYVEDIPGTPPIFHWELETKEDSGAWINVGTVVNDTLIPYGSPHAIFYYRLDSAGVPSYVDGEISSVRAEYRVLDDGTYGYALANYSSDSKALGIASDSVSFTQANYSLDGTAVKALTPALDFSYQQAFPPANTTDIWVFRKDPGTSDFVKVGSWNISSGIYSNVDGTTQTDSAYCFYDAVHISTIANPTLLDTSTSESFTTIAFATGNTSMTFDKLFIKDNRLWVACTTRKDLMLYSEATQWWNWKRTNSFAFDAPYSGVSGEPWGISDFIDVRDTSVVSGSQTMVVFTTNGIYQIGGNGSESAPYTQYLTVREIICEPGSAVFMGGVILFMSRSSLWKTGATGNHPEAYTYGPYGQKVYEYDMIKIHEVSSRVRGSSIFQVKDAIRFAIQLSNDKYIISRVSNDTMVYYRSAKGWMAANTTYETASQFFWKSKVFQPRERERTQVMNARAIKVDFVGQLKIVFRYEGPDGTNAQEITMTDDPTLGTPLIKSATRKEVVMRLPSLRSMNVQFWITGEPMTASPAIMPVLYGVKFIQ